MMTKQRTLTRAALMVAVLIVLGWLPAIPLGFIPVPIVLQNIGVMLTAMLLGPKVGSFTVVIFVGLALLGLPILAGGRGGLVVAVGPTGGFLLSYLLVPAVYALLGGGVRRPLWQQGVAIALAGVLMVDAAGAIWLSLQSGMPLLGALTATLAFLPGDLLKAAVSVAVVRGVTAAGVLKQVDVS